MAVFNKTPDDISSKLIDKGFKKYQGKVRECFSYKNIRLIVTTDRISAFDQLKGEVACRGVILNCLSNYWFGKISRSNLGIEHHFIKSINNRMFLCKDTKALECEVIVRGYLAGSLLKYVNRKKANELVDNDNFGEFDQIIINYPHFDELFTLKPYQKLPIPLVHLTSKAQLGNKDLPIFYKNFIKKSNINFNQWQQIKKHSINLYKFGSEIYKKCGFILADTKFEFGITKDKLSHDENIILIDEILTPDSSRIWHKKEYEAQYENYNYISKNQNHKTDTNANQVNNLHNHNRQCHKPLSFDKDLLRNHLTNNKLQPTNDNLDFDLTYKIAMNYLNCFEKLIYLEKKSNNKDSPDTDNLIKKNSAIKYDKTDDQRQKKDLISDLNAIDFKKIIKCIKP